MKNKATRKPWSLLVFSIGLGVGSGVADAQEADPAVDTQTPGVSVTDSGNRVNYGREYFAQYNVITARDQLERIPGIQDLLGGGGGPGGDQRGFGSSGDQVLVNGRRVSGKSNDIGAVLERIQARQVIRVEVIRGTVPDLNVRSQGRVVNVVLDDTLSTGYGSWLAEAQSYSGGHLGGGAEMSYNGDLGALNYLLSLEADSRKSSDEATDRFLRPDGTLFERHDESGLEKNRDYELSTNTSYTFSNGDILNLNGLISYREEREGERSARFDINQGQETFVRDVVITGQGNSRNWELGGDYEHVFPDGSTLTGLFVYSSDSGDERRAFSVAPAGGDTTVQSVQEEDDTSLERILRSTYEWTLGPAHAFESGGELAINTVEEQSRLFENENGAIVEQPLFNQQSEIEETRYEVFTTYTWQAASDLLVEGSLDLEYSELVQQGVDVERTRDFFFARPRLVMRYDIDSLNQLRWQVERQVEQLDFGSFVSSFTNDNNRFDVISAGNPELVPEKSWDMELTWERRLPEDMGLVSLTGRYSHIDDKSARVPLVVRTQDGDLIERTAPGNIGQGHSVSVEASASLRLGWLGLDNAVVDASVELEDTEVTDPFTGEKRDINWSAPYRWSLGFRHDTDWNSLSYGLETRQEGEQEQFDLDYRQAVTRDLDFELFAEIQPIQDLTFRLSVDQLLRSEFHRERLQFPGNRGNTILQRRELRDSRPGREISLSIQGVF